MSKSNRKIRKVELDGRQYYGYELDKTVYGIRERLYAETEEELQQKIQQADDERFQSLADGLPSKPTLKNYAELYFRYSIGMASATELKAEILLVKNAVYGSEVDIDVRNLTPEKLQEFYKNLSEKYHSDDIARLHEILKKIFVVAERAGVDVPDLENWQVPDKQDEKIQKDILTEYELKILLDTCLTIHKQNMWGIIFSLYTGIKFSEVMKIRNSDFDFEEQVVLSKNFPVPMSDECVNWLEQTVLGKALSGQKSQQEYIVKLYNNPERRKNFVKSWLEQNPDELFFTNRNGNPVRYDTAIKLLRSVAGQCGLSKNITLILLHKSFIVKELKNGVGKQELRRRYGYCEDHRF